MFELACERLYMRYLDTRRPGAPAAVLDDYWLGEPEPQVESTSTRDLFDALQHDLIGADVLRIVDPHWLTEDGLRDEVDALIAGFRARGGRVEFVAASPSSSRSAHGAPST